MFVCCGLQGKRGIVKPPFELPEFIKVCIESVETLHFFPLLRIVIEHVCVKFLSINNTHCISLRNFGVFNTST